MSLSETFVLLRFVSQNFEKFYKFYTSFIIVNFKKC